MEITASMVAAQLRMLADALDKEPDAIIRPAWVSFHCNTKEEFLNVARLLPRPLQKSIDSPGRNFARYQLEYLSPTMDVHCSVPQSTTCKLIRPAQPAVYDCDPLLPEFESQAVSE